MKSTLLRPELLLNARTGSSQVSEKCLCMENLRGGLFTLVLPVVLRASYGAGMFDLHFHYIFIILQQFCTKTSNRAQSRTIPNHMLMYSHQNWTSLVLELTGSDSYDKVKSTSHCKPVCSYFCFCCTCDRYHNEILQWVIIMREFGIVCKNSLSYPLPFRGVTSHHVFKNCTLIY